MVARQDRLHWPALWAPWPALALGVVVLSLAQWGLAQAPWSVLLAKWADDGLWLLRAIWMWALLAWPVLVLPPAWQRPALALLGTVVLAAVAGLELYFSVAGVPLGRDVFAYAWHEVRTTVAGAQLSVPWPLGLAWLAACGLLWWAVLGQRPAYWVQLQGRQMAVVLAACVAGSALLPWQMSPGQGSNKLAFFVGDVWAGQNSEAPVAASAFAFEHAESTPDTLGPLLALDPKSPPHWVFVVVEGLGRSFSGPGARLGSFTPFLDELAGRSLYWEHFLATQGRTFAVLPSVLGSLPFAPYGEQPIAHDNLLSLLKAQGYKLRYFSGSDLAFDHQGAFLAGSGVEMFWSQKDFVPPARKISEWGYPDGDLMDAVLDHPVPAQTPSVTVVQTMSMHTPFLVPDMALYRQKVQARLQALGVPPEQRKTYLEQQDIYASVLYTDEVLRRFFSRMQSQPQWSNTVFVITGDHRLPEIEMASRLERYHVPLLVYSPMLRGPMRIKSVSSHFDIAPSVLALLSNRYGMPTPERVHWMGAGLDVHPQWRNLHALPLKQTKTELSDYVSGEYYLAQDQLMSLQDGLVTAPEDNPVLAQSLRQEFAAVRARLAGLQEAQSLVRPSDKPAQVVYTEAGRSLQSAHRVQQIQGVVVSQTQAQLQADGQVNARGLFSLQGEQASPVFVPLLVLTDAQGRELAEVSGPAMTLSVGQSQTVTLSLPAKALPSTGSKEPVFVALIVSHPETGRPIGKGQYHVQVHR